jgi:hypothetical protein
MCFVATGFWGSAWITCKPRVEQRPQLLSQAGAVQVGCDSFVALPLQAPLQLSSIPALSGRCKLKCALDNAHQGCLTQSTINVEAFLCPASFPMSRTLAEIRPDTTPKCLVNYSKLSSSNREL